MVSFRNSEGNAVRGTIVNLQRKSLVMEVYNPYSIVQVSEVLHDLTVRIGTNSAYVGKAIVVSMVNTGLTAIVSANLISEWLELTDVMASPALIGAEVRAFVEDWGNHFRIRHNYQIVVNEMRAFLSEVSRWVEQVDFSEALPKTNGKLREDFFFELAAPLVERMKSYVSTLEGEAGLVEPELVPVHRAYAQNALHPFLLRAPFIFRTYTKPLGYAGDYLMVRQIMEHPQEGPSTYFQIVNAAFLQAAAAVAHRNRIDVLVEYLSRMADAALAAGRPFHILNVGCGPAFEIQRFLQDYPRPELLSFELVDFNEETLKWTQEKIESIMSQTGKRAEIRYVKESVNDLLKERIKPDAVGQKFDAVYCAGLFDYLSDKVCSRLLRHFGSRTRDGGTILVTNVHSNNPERLFFMEHLLEWYLIYRDEAKMNDLLQEKWTNRKIYTEKTGVNIFVEVTV